MYGFVSYQSRNYARNRPYTVFNRAKKKNAKKKKGPRIVSRRSTTGSGENALRGKTRRRPPSPPPPPPPPTDSLRAGITRALFRHRRARRQSRAALGVVCIAAAAVASRVPRPTTIVHEARRRVLADSAVRRHRKFFRFLQLRTVANGTLGPMAFVSVDRRVNTSNSNGAEPVLYERVDSPLTEVWLY